MNRWISTLALMAPALCVVAVERDAQACGGCFHPPTQVASDITDERMLLSVSPTQTRSMTSIGTREPRVLRVGAAHPRHRRRRAQRRRALRRGRHAHGDADRRAGAQLPAAAARLLLPTAGAGGSSSSGGGGLNGSDPGGVIVTKQENVGPYATVQLHSTDSDGAQYLALAEMGITSPPTSRRSSTRIWQEGFDFLAMKLLPEPGRAGDAPRARHDARRVAVAAVAHGRRRHRGDRRASPSGW